MPGCKRRAAFYRKRCLLCNSRRPYFPRVVTFNRSFIRGFLLPADLGLARFGALVVRTHNERARLQVLLQQIRAAALRAGFVDRLIRRSKPALRIVGATVEEIPATRLFLR